MTSPFGKAIVIANPFAGKGRLGRGREVLEELLRETGIEFELRPTERRGQAAELAREAIGEGHRFLVAAGGDGTIHEVVNGMMGESGPLNPEAVLGIISAGSGSDFIRTFGLPSEPADAVRHLPGDNLYRIDVGRVAHTVGGETRTEYFPNIAEAGLGGEVVRRAEGLPRSLGRVRYLLSFWIALGLSRSTEGRVLLDDRVYEGRITNLVVANAQFFGGGMRIAPKANPADGRFDVLVQSGSKADYVAGITKVFKGEHLPSPAIKEYYAKRVEVRSERPLRVEADGEVLGVTPAVFEIVPGAVNLKI